jgi:hypothetical protein
MKRRPWSAWDSISARLQGPCRATRLVTAGIGVALLLVPTRIVWPDLFSAGTLVSADVLDWAKGSLSLIVLLQHRLRKRNGE